MAGELQGKQVGVLAADGVEQVELAFCAAIVKALAGS